MFMPQEPSAIEQAVSRAIRDNLESIQRATDELNQAVNDVVAACASSKPSNALPPMLRAQSTAASIAAALEVLSRFVAITLNPGPRSPLEAEMTRLTSAISAEAARHLHAIAPARETTSAPAVHEPSTSLPESVSSADSHPGTAESPRFEPSHQPQNLGAEPATLELPQPGPFPDDIEVETEDDFDVNQLSGEEQELHRRANRVAKVSMQDIKMLRPEAVRLGRENKDLCVRLRDDIEKAHREYDRRFRPIMDHPVDYFYRWMVEILADGDAHALGEYPYAIHANHR
jgi:hypothetical protein